MTIQKIRDFLDHTDNKDFYKEWFVEVCGEICKILNRDLNECEMETILRTYFDQVKDGRN